MTINLFTRLWIESLKDVLAARGRQQTDEGYQQQEELLQVRDLQSEGIPHVNPNITENALLQGYFQMADNEYFSYTPEIHIWFLERLLMSDYRIYTKELTRLANLYLAFDNGVIRYLVINLFCNLDAENLVYTRNGIDAIIETKFNEQRLNNDTEIFFQQLTDILVDISNPTSLYLLRDLLNSERERNRTFFVENQIRDRARDLRSKGQYLRDLL